MTPAVAARRSWHILTAAALLLLTLFVYGLSLVKRVNEANRTWHVYSGQTLQVQEALRRFAMNFGYGGFIHDFNQVLLSRDLSLLARLEYHLEATHDGIVPLKHVDLPPEERQALDELLAVIVAYDGKLQLARQLMDEGIAPEVIAPQLEVNDLNAVWALSLLYRYTEEAEREMLARTETALGEVVTRLQWGAMLVIPVLLVAWLLIADRRRLDRVNRRLDESHRYVEDVIESVPDGLLVVGPEGDIQRVNGAAETLFGYPREQLLRMKVEDLMPERFRAHHPTLRNRAWRADGGQPTISPTARFLALNRSGGEVPIELGIRLTAEGGQQRAVATVRDVSERIALEQLAQERYATLQTAQSIARIGSWSWQIGADEHHWTEEVYRLFGTDPQTTAPGYAAFLAHLHPADRERVEHAVRNTLDEGAPYEEEFRIVRADGHERVVLGIGQRLDGEDGSPQRVVGMLWDITERKQAEQALLFDKAIIEGTSQPIVVIGQDGCIEDMNSAYCEMSGYDRAELLGMPASTVNSEQHDPNLCRTLWDSLAAERTWEGEYWVKRKDGGAVPRLLSITTICEPELNRCRYVGFYSDISSLKESEARLEQIAHFDHLTGLANRLLFQDRLRAALARARRADSLAGLLYIDLDGFKQVNDTLGHQAGDDLLVDVARRLEACVREDDTVARLGGDEFAVIMNDLADADMALALARRMVERLQITMPAADGPLQVTASIGLAIYPEHGDALESLLEQADRAMYAAKQAGKNACVSASA